MKSYIGVGTGSAANAVSEATRGLQSPEAIIFIAPHDYMQEVARLLQEQYPQTPAIGTIGTKLVNGQVSDKNVSVLGLFSDAKVRCGIIENISECPVVAVKDIERKIAEVAPGKDNTVCIEFCTGEEEKLVTTFTSCLAKKGVRWPAELRSERRKENRPWWPIMGKYMRMPVLMPLSKIR